MCLGTYSQRQQLQRRHKTAAERFRRLKVSENSIRVLKESHDKLSVLCCVVGKVLGNGWRQWLERCEHCEEIKMLPFTRRARQHFRFIQ